MSDVELVELTEDNVRAVIDLSVRRDQDDFVAPNAVSIAQAYVSPDAWPRAIYADDQPVGFVMLSLEPDRPQYYLWRFMIDGRHQRRGHGTAALAAVVEFVRARPGATELLSSYVPGDGSPGPFYLAFGFEETGRSHDGERVIRLPL